MAAPHTDGWNALGDSSEKATNLSLRSDVMTEIARKIRDSGWTQAEAAERCGITQPRVNDLLQGKISKFSLDALVNIATTLGQRVTILVET